jgi:Uma2 family endonuclease
MAIKDPPQATAVVQERYRFDRQQYHALVQAGVLKEDTRVELIRGDLTVMSPISPRHAGTVKRLNFVFSRRLGERAVIGVQDPFAIGDDNEPEPDLSVLKPRADFYAADHPQPADLLLVVEVADTSLRYDREVKVPLYAAAGISEVWVLNLADNLLEIYREPGPKGFRSLQRLSPGDQVSPLAFPDLNLAVADLLPPAAD